MSNSVARPGRAIGLSHATGFDWTTLAMLSVVTFVGRLQAFGNPITNFDEDFYLTCARFMAQGAWPYIDFWDRKPVGIFLIYYPAALVGGWLAVYVYQLMAMAAVVATGMVIDRIANRLGWGRGGPAAAVFYAVWIIVARGHDGQASVFYNLPMAIAALLIVRRVQEEDDSSLAAWGAMLACGIVLQIKYSAVYEGFYFGLFLLWADWREGARLGRLILRAVYYAGTALLPTAAVFLVYASVGHAGEFIQANIQANLTRALDPWPLMMKNAGVMIGILAVPVALALWNTRESRFPGGMTAAHRFVAGWLLAALVGIAIFPPWFDHYAMPALLVASILAARAFCMVGRRSLTTGLLVIGAVSQIVLFARIKSQGNPRQLQALAGAIGKGDGSMFIYRAPHALYWLTGRPAPTRFLFQGTLSTLREKDALGVSQAAEVHRILSDARPDIIVMSSLASDRRANETPGIRAMLQAEIDRSYRSGGTLPLGRFKMLVYRRRLGAEPAAPTGLSIR